MNVIQGTIVENRKGMSHWRPLLKKWVSLNKKYCKMLRGTDAPWIYTERALTGLLCAAAWQCNRVSLEEFQHPKGHKNSEKRYGRADLYIKGDKANEELVEAKFSWLSLTSSKNLSRAEITMNKAIKDIKDTLGENADIRGIAVSYFPVYMAASSKKDVSEQIVKCIDELRNDGDYHALAWAFPKEYRTVVGDSGKYCPGVILAAKNFAYR